MRKFRVILKRSVILILLFTLSIFAIDYITLNGLPFLGKTKTDEYSSYAIYVFDRESKEIYYEKNAHEKVYPASLTKMMTTLVALEHIDDLSQVAPIDVTTYQEMVAQNASMAGFYGNEAVTYRDLLYGTILSSGGEAANSLALNVANDLPSFVNLMNSKADALNLKNTYFTNPEGMHHERQYTTAYDMGVLVDNALENGHFKAVFTKETFQTSATLDHPQGIQLVSTVLSQIDSANQHGFQIIGGKSGTTPEAGQCWATVALVNGREVISIVMGAPLNDITSPDGSQITDTLKLFSLVAQQ